ncbi:hypothetical protein PUN28_011334 [Cardiocondyla obscurior]|uniref:Uncharacterized protein n=1 Tax=Cardiocondyla obscurior TaxID=286306 RepID=A0AAW2FHQ9_9HYME
MAGDRKPRHPRGVHRHRAAFDRTYRSTQHISARREEKHFPREDVEKSIIFDLVYKYLSKCADKDMKSRQRKCACNMFNNQHARKKDIRERDIATFPTNVDKGIFHNSNKWLRSRTNKNVFFKRIHRSSSREFVADYMKAVHDGRRRAKFYVRDALLYGLHTGLLSLTNRRRNVVNISRKLGIFPSKDTEKDNEDPL